MTGSQTGTGGYAQLLFDDSAGKSRTVLQQYTSQHAATAELNLGHLRHQNDNQLIGPVGFGAELSTEHATSLRAGQGMLLSTDARSNAISSQLDSGEAQAQVSASFSLQETLATSAQKHGAMLKDPVGKTEATAAKLPALVQMQQSADILADTGNGSTGPGAGSGGQGTATAYAQAQLQLSSPNGIVAATPATALLAAGNTSSIATGQDINALAQGSHHYSVSGGISMFTYGKADKKTKPNQETGIRLHAASGKMSSQSQSGATRITADKAITVASVTKAVSVTAKEHVLLTAQGASLRIEGGNIMLHGPGKIAFKASKKELTGPQSAALTLPALPKPENLSNFVELNHHWPDLTPVAGGAYRAVFADGTVKEGTLDHKGFARLENIPPGPVQVYYGEAPRPYVPPPVQDAGKTTLAAIQAELEKLGYEADADGIDFLLETLAGRSLQ